MSFNESDIIKTIRILRSGGPIYYHVVKCDNCNKEMNKNSSDFKRCKSRYCNKCFYIVKRNQIDKICKKCLISKKITEFAFDFRVSRPGSYSKLCKNCDNISTSSNIKISSNEFNNILNLQNGKCAICKKEEITKFRDGRIKRLAIDHCHVTGYIRGLLCSNCNTSLGGFKDSIEYLKEAINYLEKSK